MIKKAADYLVERFKTLGFTVMRYDAYTTNSVYLKLDDGVVGTIRISDHKGKKNLRYKYNLIKGSQRYKRDHRGVTRYYLPMRDIEMLVEKVVYDREVLMNKYGEESYIRFRIKNKKEGLKSRGFWQQAKYV